MKWNPFDRRSQDLRAIDEALLGLGKPPWSDSRSADQTMQFVREALGAWRIEATPLTVDPNHARRDKVRKIVDRERANENRVSVEVAEMNALRASTRGRVVYSVVVLAAEVSGLEAWTAIDVAHRIVRIDLSSEVVSVARSAGQLEAAFKRLGPPPTGHLADDAEVQKIYRERTDALADRQRTLIARLTALRSYLDGLIDIEKELQKVRWIENHGTPDEAEFEAREGDELGSLHLSAARDMFDEATDRIGVQLRDAAEQWGGRSRAGELPAEMEPSGTTVRLT